MPWTLAQRHAAINAYTGQGLAFGPNASLFLSLHTADPGDTGLNENSAYGNATRPAITFAAAAAGSAASAAQIDFTTMPAITVTHVGLWSSGTKGAGTFLGGGALSLSKTTAAGDTLRFAAAAVTTSVA